MKHRDSISGIAKRAIDTLFLFNPLGTAIGFLIGVVLDGARVALLPAFQPVRSIMDLARLQLWHSVAFSIVLVNAPNFIAGRRELPRDVEEAFETIHRLEGRVPDEQLKEQYIKLCAAVVSRIEIPQGRRKPPALPA